MLLAPHDNALSLGGELIALRPTLRCALRLERREGGFTQLISDLQEGSLTAALFVLRDHYKHPFADVHVLDTGIDDVCAVLVRFVLECAGIDPDAKAERNEKGEKLEVSFAEHLAHLYRIGTGWLGWTPRDTLDATPAEITEAYYGRVEMLRAIFGGGDTAKPKATPDQIREAFRSLGAKRVH